MLMSDADVVAGRHCLSLLFVGTRSYPIYGCVTKIQRYTTMYYRIHGSKCTRQIVSSPAAHVDEVCYCENVLCNMGNYVSRQPLGPQ